MPCMHRSRTSCHPMFGTIRHRSVTMARSQIGPSAILLARAQPTGWGWLLNGTAVNVYVPWRRFAARLPWVESGTHDHAVNLFRDRAVTWPKLIAGQILFEDPDNLRNGARVLVDA